MHVPPGNAMFYRTRSANANALQYFDAFALYKLGAHQLNSLFPTRYSLLIILLSIRENM